MYKTLTSFTLFDNTNLFYCVAIIILGNLRQISEIGVILNIF